MEYYKKLIAENIAKYRKMAKLTQTELAEKLNYSDKSVSKWERGDSLPDVVVLKQMANIFGISLDTLVSENIQKPSKVKKFMNKVYTNKVLISSCSTLIVWLVATLVFALLSIFTSLPRLWLVFVYATAINLIVLVSLCGFWKNKWYTFLTASGTIISVMLALYLTFNMQKLSLLFFVCIPLVALAFIWFVLRKNILRKIKRNRL